MLNVVVLSLFPEMLSMLSGSGVVGRAFREGFVQLNVINPRDFAKDKHRTVDDRPYGGGPGMLMKVEPLELALEAGVAWLADRAGQESKSEVDVIYMSPQGHVLDTPLLDRLLGRQLISDAGSQSLDKVRREATLGQVHATKSLLIIAGRYEGIDQRFIDTYVDQEVSIGDYVLSGGELPAMVMLDAMIRRIPGVLGSEGSFEQDSFEDGLLDYPHFTRPAEYCGQAVPEVLLSGDHKAIARWRRRQALGNTWLRRPDLLKDARLSDEDLALLAEFKTAMNEDSET